MKLTKPIAAVLIVVVLSASSNAEVVFEHNGANDPTSQGWAVLGSGLGVNTGPIVNDIGSGIDAWFIDDLLTSGGSVTQYSQTPSASSNTAAVTLGWTLSVNLRMVESSSGTFEGMFADYRNGTQEFTMYFERALDGDPMVRLEGGASFTLEGVGDSGYHQFDLVYDANAASADLFVDGVEVVSDFAGIPSTVNRVAWGANGSDATGRGHFNHVSFSTIAVPEPSSLFICVAGGPVLLIRKPARNRKG